MGTRKEFEALSERLDKAEARNAELEREVGELKERNRQLRWVTLSMGILLAVVFVVVLGKPGEALGVVHILLQTMGGKSH